MHVWQKTARSEPALGEWLERISAAVGMSRIAIVYPRNGLSARLEIYCDGVAEANELARQFGGRVQEVTPSSWQPKAAAAPGKPLAVGGRLLLTAHPEELADLRAAHPRKQVLCIPAAMAFGTGEHATTSLCLRLLIECSQARAGTPWNLLDLGAGSGVLALAGRQFGARMALGVDNDPDAVRTARNNARLNGLRAPGVRFVQASLDSWTPPLGERWQVITANLFSGLLARLIPGLISSALAPGSDLILSGILGAQEAEIVAIAKSARLEVLKVARRGRWRALHAISRLAR
jgi:ribosomal protein L11 methyltransferase